MDVLLPFSDRREAGRKLAEELIKYKGNKDVVILSLVRGGVVTGSALSDELNLPLYPFVVRKLGHPWHREYGLGAISEGGATYLNEKIMKSEDLSLEDMEPVIAEEDDELSRRKKAYLISARPPLKGKVIILTDDGAATGGTLFAAIEDLRKNFGASKVIVALPVSPTDTALRLQEISDECIILATPRFFEAVGKWYRDFQQVEDEEVLQIMKQAEQVVG